MAERRMMESCILFFAKTDEESPLSLIDQHVIRSLLEVRWKPVCITEEEEGHCHLGIPATVYTDPDDPTIFHNAGDEPAVKYSNGRTCWYKYGKLHRNNDKPAVDSMWCIKIYSTYPRDVYQS